MCRILTVSTDRTLVAARAYLDSGVNARLGVGRIGLTLGVANLLDTRGNRFALGTPFATGRDQVDDPARPGCGVLRQAARN